MPAPTGAGSSLSVLYHAGPWAWGRGMPPARGTSLSTQKRKEKGQGALEQTDSTVLTHLRALSPEATVQAAASLPGELVLLPGAVHSPEGAGLSQLHPRVSSLPTARPAALEALGQGGGRLRPFIGQIQGTAIFPQSVKVNQLCPSLTF